MVETSSTIDDIFKDEINIRKEQMDYWIRNLQHPKTKLYTFFTGLYDTFSFHKKQKPAILFTELRYKHIIESLRYKGFRCIVIPNSFDDVSYALKNRIEIYPNVRLVEQIIKYYNGSISSEELYKYVINELVRLNVFSIIMYKDYPLINLLVTLAAKYVAIKTISIQHGIYNVDGNYHDGDHVDLVLVYGTIWKKYYSRFISTSKIRVAGYPYRIVNAPYNSRDKNVIFLSQNIENYLNIKGRDELKLEFNTIDELIEYKVRYVTNISDELDKYGKQLIIKPHPGESTDQFKNLNCPIFKGTMEDCIHKYNKFVSLSSTGLLDASINNKLAIQIRNDKLSPSKINFEKYGISYSIHQDDLSKIKTLIDNTPYQVDKNMALKNNNYVEELIEYMGRGQVQFP